MRGLRNFIILICELIIFALLVIFAVENITPMRYRFIGNTFEGNVWWTVAGCALLGFLFAVFMLGPGTISAGWRSRSLARQHGRTAEELAALRAEHERLRAEHARTLNERNQLQGALSGMSASNADTSMSRTTATRYGEGDGATDGVTQTTRTDQVTAPQSRAGTMDQTMASQPQADANAGTYAGTNYEPETAQGNGWRGRLRRLREGNGETADDMGTPNSPPAPTA